MSRIGKMPVSIPEGIEVIQRSEVLEIKGPLGELCLSFEAAKCLEVQIQDSMITLSPREQTKQARSLWGTYRSLLEQKMIGVSQGYVTNLELVGVGYKASREGNLLVLKVGYSHEIRHVIPEGITISCVKPTYLSIRGIDKQKVNLEAARLRAYKKPEPYKGKGILYENEKIKLKEGKKK
uniref:Ribosomal protein L6 n=1 Tax=Andalucia godoyi TaxID=505711 RepID=M4Q992_ANDGO|nr:ribosomal protein L6 [Andalucia godoyi]AGH23987.1 ribosomal protein L6 [Andalucia godoyi]